MLQKEKTKNKAAATTPQQQAAAAQLFDVHKNILMKNLFN